MKHPDVGFGMTVQDANAKDLVPLYDLSNELNMEFATASLHNSFYFVEAKNIINLYIIAVTIISSLLLIIIFPIIYIINRKRRKTNLI